MNIGDYLKVNAVKYPNKSAFIFLEDGEAKEYIISFSELNEKVQQLSSFLNGRNVPGKRAILLFEDSLSFIVSFLACQSLGIIAIPVNYSKNKKQLLRIESLIEDANASVILTTESIEKYLLKEDLEVIANHSLSIINIETKHDFKETGDKTSYLQSEIAFIQYTSGSTSNPKGVIISHENLISNQKAIQEAFGCDPDSIIFSWLPFHHDMGLIGNILHSVFVGCTCILMSPYHFIQKPIRWLQAITNYNVTHSGGPNFAFELCVSAISNKDLLNLNLTKWKVAYCGAEPINNDTINQFIEKFTSVGFDRLHFYPCYGLAEATLLVSAKNKNSISNVSYIDLEKTINEKIVLADETHHNTNSIISCGPVSDSISVKIISNTTQVCDELQEGEVCISGSSVTEGYWNKDNKNVFYEIEGREYLRTGDLGFFHNKELYIHGRIKEIIIFRGKNYYPNDIERVVYNCDEAIVKNGVAVFSIASMNEKIVILVEIKREFIFTIEASDIISKIYKTVTGTYGIDVYDVLLVTPFTIPRTTSGKLKRLESSEKYTSEAFSILESKNRLHKQTNTLIYEVKNFIDKVNNTGDHNSIKNYLMYVIAKKVETKYESESEDIELVNLGLDSLRLMEIINMINKDLQLNLSVTKMMHNPTLYGLVSTIENMIWLKNNKPSDKNIII